MAYENRPNTGTLFINQKKTTENQPDLRGAVHVDRTLLENLLKKNTPLVELSIAAWNKESAKGVVYLSLAVSEPYVAPQSAQSSNEKQPWEK
jgi:hypothetical protein